MGTEHYAIISYIEGHAFNNREQTAVKIVNAKLKGHFQFTQMNTMEGIGIPSGRCFFGRMKHYDESKLLALIASLPWLMPDTVQVFVQSEHEDRYGELLFETPAGYQPGMTWAGSGDVEYIERLKGATK